MMDHVKQAEHAREEDKSANGFTRDDDIVADDELHNRKAPHEVIRKEKEQLGEIISKDKLEPRVGMEFDDDELAYQFYNEYARRVGFSIRKQHLTKNKCGQVTFRRFVCYREGYYRNRPFDKDAKILRTDGRTGCNAHIDRRKWGLIYGRDSFSADIKSALRSEHMHPILKTHLNAEKDLLSFFKVYERLVEDRRYNELQADVHASQSMLEVPLSRLLKQVASIYTPKVYEMFVKEFKLYVDCVIENCGNDGNHYEVTNLEKQSKSYVRYDSTEDALKCSCKKFEAIGILCSHAMKVLDFKNIKEIPQKYILKRWRKDVKDGLSISRYDGSNEIDPTIAIANRYASLGHAYLHIVAKGSKCQEAYDIAIEEAQKISNKVNFALQNRSLEMSSPQSSDDQLQELMVDAICPNKEDGKLRNQGTNFYKNPNKQHRRRKVLIAEERITRKRERKGQSDDVLAGSGTSPPVRIQPHLTVSNNQYDPWPSFRCLSLQYPSTGQESLISNPSQPPFGIINQLNQNEPTCIMFSQSPAASSFPDEPSEH
ncbi:hypothetical protein ZIOFF_065915 [Zingiber officinale]|uniref:Protein FAR1-RELATED SEQUENCE n=1 Tax=Zingiber officinale TaxID=94328 RepID=A0A8J5K7A9_ZINOF|nr:hypothetical protein ZIOFF_065915 [Zingiber officinale]